MNKPLLRKIIKQIQKEPRKLNMEEYHCGTSHCIAGWATVLTGRKKDPYSFGYSVLETAREVLDLRYDIAKDLFYPLRWPYRYQAQYYQAKNRTEKAKIAVNRIRYLMRTGN